MPRQTRSNAQLIVTLFALLRVDAAQLHRGNTLYLTIYVKYKYMCHIYVASNYPNKNKN